MDFLRKALKLLHAALEKLVDLLGSMPVILAFGTWVIYHTAVNREYVAFISDVTFWVGLVILKGQTADAKQQKRYVKQDLAESKKVLRVVRRIWKRLKSETKSKSNGTAKS